MKRLLAPPKASMGRSVGGKGAFSSLLLCLRLPKIRLGGEGGGALSESRTVGVEVPKAGRTNHMVLAVLACRFALINNCLSSHIKLMNRNFYSYFPNGQNEKQRG